MPKQKTNLRYIYKIHSSRLRQSDWSLSLSIQEAINNKELVTIADSEVLRYLNKGRNVDEKANELSKQINKLKKKVASIENKNAIKTLYKQKYNILFVKDYVCVIIDKMKDFDLMNGIQGFFINGIRFKRLLATNGGVKKSTIVYVSEKVYDGLHAKIENGRNKDVQLVPAKLEAYRALACSASTPLSHPNGVLVVKDCITEFTDDVILLDDTKTRYPELTTIENYPIKLKESDGYGLISPELSKRWSIELGEDYTVAGFCIRNSFCKGMAFTFDFHGFSEKIAKSYMVKDAWGYEQDIRNIDLILTTSMLKLWDSYNSIEHYLSCCKENEYNFSVTKTTPKELENERNLNYQFIQSYEFTDEEIDELVQPTIQEIKDALGNNPVKSILFLKGMGLTEDNYAIQENDIVDALIIDKRMINDPFIKNKIYNMIKKRINDAKIGVLRTKGNFSIISGDPYSLCQHMFGMKVTGLLKAGEFYSKYWNDRNIDKVVAYRAPMTCHNNIRVLSLTKGKEVDYWYQYMDTVTILNSWDTTCHALNGADKDSDQILTSSSPVLLKKTVELPAVLCVQKSAQKKISTEEDLIQSNKDGFGDEIGPTTNRITTMIDVASSFDKDSKEYRELQYRIISGQNYQQNAIDKMKGILCKKMPKEWYDYRSARDSSNKELNLRILADKKPYFFIYNYPHEMKRYKRYIENSNRNCLMRFGLTVDELLEKQDKTEDQKIFIKHYHRKMPVFMNKSVMNRICWRIEQEFDGIKDSFSDLPFDYSILMSENGYTEKNFEEVKKLYSLYKIKLKQYSQTSKVNKESIEDRAITRSIFKEDFRRMAYEICNNSDELCNIVVELCYQNNSSKQFAWDVCGDVIIKNLLQRNDYQVQYPVADKSGDIEFGGEKFSLYTAKINEVDCETNIK